MKVNSQGIHTCICKPNKTEIKIFNFEIRILHTVAL